MQYCLTVKVYIVNLFACKFTFLDVSKTFDTLRQYSSLYAPKRINKTNVFYSEQCAV